jgi:hypothetical protein
VRAFISYSHKDSGALDRLHTHLAVLKREGKITEWYDREILAGGEVDKEIATQLASSDLLENSNELQAQPLMALPVQWHYFGLCATASARELVNKKVLSEANFVTLRALQDDSVSWLANIPIEGLVEMRRNSEVVTFREELKKYTSQLAAAGPLELNDVVKEVNHGLASLVQRHAKAMEDVRTKYWPKIVGAAAGAAVRAAGMGSLAFLPALASVAGVAAPVGAMLGALGGGALGAVKEIAGAKAEQRQLYRHSLLGMLASAWKSR